MKRRILRWDSGCFNNLFKVKRRILRWDSGCLNNRLHSLCKVDWPILRWDMTSNLAVVYTIRIREPSPKWIGINTVGFWMLQQHRPQKVQNSPKFHHVGSASKCSAPPSRRCICLFHLAVSEYMPKSTYFASCRCISLFHYASPGYIPKLFPRPRFLRLPCRLAGVYVSFTLPRLSICQKSPTFHHASV